MCTTRLFKVLSQLASNASLSVGAPKLLQGRVQCATGTV